MDHRITITRRKTRSRTRRPRRDARKSSSVDTTDRLNELPNELLIIILSSLTMKEAARTSILSKRWKTLWTYYYGFLDFDFSTHRIYHKFCYTRKFIDYVNKVLNSHQSVGVAINKLRICWRLYDEFTSVIDSWIDFTMKNRVQHFELDTCGGDYKFPLETLMGTTRIGFCNLKVLQLKSVNLMGTTGIGFCHLNVLWLVECVNLTDETMAFFCSSDKFPSLRHISVKSARSLAHVKVVGNLKLNSLKFNNCWNVEDVEISSAINLVSFRFRGPKLKKLTFEDVPLLTEAIFGGYCTRNVVRFPFARQLSSFLSQLEILILDFSGMDVFSHHFVISQFPKFDRVKRLEVVAYNPPPEDLNMCVMAMIYGCPRLQKFSLKMMYKDRDEKYDLGIIFPKIHHEHPHECLRFVDYIGWNGNKDDLEIIIDLLKNTMQLDKVTIDPRTTFFSHEDKSRIEEFIIHDKKREKDARKAAEKLRRILPQRVTLVVL